MRYPLAVAALLLVAFATFARPTLAEPPEDAAPDDEPLGALASDEPSFGTAAPPLWLSIGALGGSGPNGIELRGMLTLGTSLDKLARAGRVGAERAKTQTDDEATEESTPVEERAERPSPLVNGALARGLVRAALATARESERRRDLDDLALRARLSGLLPELRVRLAHALDQDQALSPTEYDPERVTASGGTSLWIEGRATFRLDRLVFADEEVAIERLRADRERAERALVTESLRALDRWQRARGHAADPALPDDKRVEAELEAAAAEATLDVMTDGWFSGPAGRRLARPR